MKEHTALSCVLACLTLATAAPAQTVQYTSPAGKVYRSYPDTGSIKALRDSVAANPNDVQRYITLGLAQSNLREFREAIATFTRALKLDPNNAVLYRWRGHRYLSLRQFDDAERDLARATKLDSTLYGAWYHLGIVRFVKGNFNGAAQAFARAQPRAPDAGELAGSTDWLWMSLARAGRGGEANAMLAKHLDSLQVDNAYAKRLKLYRGQLKPADFLIDADTGDVNRSTLAFGVGNWELVHGNVPVARSWFQRSVAEGGWPAFGFIMSEVELRRTKRQ